MSELENKLSKKYIVPVSFCDNKAQLSFTGIFNLFMDLATEHAAILGIGNNALKEKNCFWVAAKSRIKVIRRPSMLEEVTASTWPEKPKTIRYNRYYTVSDQSGVIIEGKTEWTIINADSGRPQKASEVYPLELEHISDTVCDAPFDRISADFAECEELCTHKVRSQDIDLSVHMNNVAYIRAVLCAFTTKEIEAMDIKEIEIAYRLQCFEGEVLSIRRRNTETSTEIGIVKEDGTTAAVLKLS